MPTTNPPGRGIWCLPSGHRTAGCCRHFPRLASAFFLLIPGTVYRLYPYCKRTKLHCKHKKPLLKHKMPFLKHKMPLLKHKMPLLNLRSYFVNIRSHFVNIRSHFVNCRSPFVNMRSHFSNMRSRLARVRLPTRTYLMIKPCALCFCETTKVFFDRQKIDLLDFLVIFKGEK